MNPKRIKRVFYLGIIGLLILILLPTTIAIIPSNTSASIRIPETSGLPGPAGWAIDLVLNAMRIDTNLCDPNGALISNVFPIFVKSSILMGKLGGGEKNDTGNYPLEIPVYLDLELNLTNYDQLLITGIVSGIIENAFMIDGFQVDIIPEFSLTNRFNILTTGPIFRLQEFKFLVKARGHRDLDVVGYIEDKLNQEVPNFVDELADKLGNVEVFFFGGGFYAYDFEEENHEFGITFGQGADAKVTGVEITGEVDEEGKLKATGNSFDIEVKASASYFGLGKEWSKKFRIAGKESDNENVDGAKVNFDKDKDGLPNKYEDLVSDLDPSKPDTDGDSIWDGNEKLIWGTDPNRRDTDKDGLMDGNEIDYFLNNNIDPTVDYDMDGNHNLLDWDSDDDSLSDDEEKHYGTNPIVPDTDGDALSDPDELTLCTNPNKKLGDPNPDPTIKDTDDDKWNDYREWEFLSQVESDPNLLLEALNPSDPNYAIYYQKVIQLLNQIKIGSLISSTLGPCGDHDSDSLHNLRDGDFPFFPPPPWDPNEDTDQDNLFNNEEAYIGWVLCDPNLSNVRVFSSPYHADIDNDGLNDLLEKNMQTNPLTPDTDGDGLMDGEESQYNTSPCDPDSDDDGINDYEEINGYNWAVARASDAVPFNLNLNPGFTYTMSPNISVALSFPLFDYQTDYWYNSPDPYRIAWTSNPINPDTDGDGVPDGYEKLLVLDPNCVDTDGDGLDDPEGWDVIMNPTNHTHYIPLIDYDSQTQAIKSAQPGDVKWLIQNIGGMGTDPHFPDTDMDGIWDNEEADYGTDPTNPDSDGDLLKDGYEVMADPNDPNVGICVDPLDPDTDGDGLTDGFEIFYNIKRGTNFEVVTPSVRILGRPIYDGQLMIITIEGPKAIGDPNLALHPCDRDTDDNGISDLFELLRFGVLQPFFRIDSDGLLISPFVRAWEFNRDLNEVHFTLNPDVEFQDGTFLDSDGMQYNLMNPLKWSQENTRPALIESELVSGVNASGDFTFIVKLTEPDPNQLFELLVDYLIASPQAMIQYGEEFPLHPVGTGPFRVQQYDTQNQVMILEEFLIGHACTEGLGACECTGVFVHGLDGDPVCDCIPGTPTGEMCNSIDDDCDGEINEEGADGCVDYYRDRDSDGYGITPDVHCLCAQEGEYRAVHNGDCDDSNPEVNPGKMEIYDGIDNDCDGQVDEICYFDGSLTAQGQDHNTFSQTASVIFGLDSVVDIVVDPYNWSTDQVVRLQLIDPNVDLFDPDTFSDEDLLTTEVFNAMGQDEIAWYIQVKIGDQADPFNKGYYPLLFWDANDLGCKEAYGREYVYQLRRGLGRTGSVLVDNMLIKSSYQTKQQDGDPIQYFTLLWREKQESPPPSPGAGYPFPGAFWGPGFFPPVLNLGFNLLPTFLSGALIYQIGFPIMGTLQSTYPWAFGYQTFGTGTFQTGIPGGIPFQTGIPGIGTLQGTYPWASGYQTFGTGTFQTGIPGSFPFQTGIPGIGTLQGTYPWAFGYQTFGTGTFQTGIPGGFPFQTGIPGIWTLPTGISGVRGFQSGMPGTDIYQTGWPGINLFPFNR